MNDDSGKVIASSEILPFQHIVSALEDFDEVREAQVFQVGSDSSERLVALLVPVSETIAFSLLRRQLHEVSSEVPVPAELIIVDSIDKNTPLSEQLDLYDKFFKQESAYVKPCNAIESYLVRLWGELLPVGRISVTDDFFALGGHSLLVAKMHFMIERDMGIYMNFELMLRTSVLSELAQIITQMKHESKL
ncbi:hypothetical protein I6N90_00855 [Paenibacillus sp. GSMTC-2017]|uniref:phosphopantetheine-binding protein n=1 Tax=Paenibacillus sp. GSMTC-2017 TaxID=2794350 RepID=UPI0018D832D9|nr:phosphopantetheine-binding protein [Paenibacillus sp. GSMTC-2017]MBH5316354.1 hypothetical protein [Paenibacillus sp. GSMTC-2017]